MVFFSLFMTSSHRMATEHNLHTFCKNKNFFFLEENICTMGAKNQRHLKEWWQSLTFIKLLITIKTRVHLHTGSMPWRPYWWTQAWILTLLGAQLGLRGHTSKTSVYSSRNETQRFAEMFCSSQQNLACLTISSVSSSSLTSNPGLYFSILLFPGSWRVSGVGQSEFGCTWRQKLVQREWIRKRVARLAW